MSGCAVEWCGGEMQGQMLACASHWLLLSAPLRDDLVAAWDQRRREDAAGNLRRATRDRYSDLAQQAAAEWAAVRRELAEAYPGLPLGHEGSQWVALWDDVGRRAGEPVLQAAEDG